MKIIHKLSLAVLILTRATVIAQPATSLTPVPHLVRISSSYRPASGSPAAVENVVFSVYSQETGGSALWQETQNVTVDQDGRYSVLLGSTRNEGLPVDLFAANEQRWLGIHVQRAGETEQARILMASVPYALKASDADTLGGLPASAYLLNPSADVPAAASTSDGARPVKATPRFVSSGTTGSIAMFTDNAGDIGNSALFQNGAKVGLGTTNPLDYLHVAFTDSTGVFTGYAVQNLSSNASAYSGMLFYDQAGVLGQFQGFNNSTHEYRINNIARNGSNQLNGSINFMIGGSSKFLVRTDGDVDIPGSVRKGGTLFLHNIGSNTTAVGLGALASTTPSTNGLGSTAVGASALAANTDGNFNSALGAVALSSNTSGNANTAVGQSSLFSNTTGSNNTAIGTTSLAFNGSGSNNTAIGNAALSNSAGSNNVALGDHAGVISTGNLSAAIGNNALSSSTGEGNIALGYKAGFNLTNGDYNIMIGNQGLSGDTTTIRLGDAVHTKAFITGIFGATATGGVAVLVNQFGQLGVTTSSRRYKEDIQDMGDTSSNLFRLRPVTYRYKQPYPDGSKPIDYGLVAEEVADLYPDLVIRNKDGQIETVQYQKLVPMLLNELQKQNARLEALEALLLNNKVTAER